MKRIVLLVTSLFVLIPFLKAQSISYTPEQFVRDAGPYSIFTTKTGAHLVVTAHLEPILPGGWEVEDALVTALPTEAPLLVVTRFAYDPHLVAVTQVIQALIEDGYRRWVPGDHGLLKSWWDTEIGGVKVRTELSTPRERRESQTSHTKRHMRRLKIALNLWAKEFNRKPKG